MRKSVWVAVLIGTALSISSTMAVAAKKADPAIAANRDTARLVHDAVDPYCATSGKHCHRHHHRWGWGGGWHHQHHDWGWGSQHHHHHGHHHRHHKKAM